jgi:antitoxin component of MazEF toxin-antitoxin module
LPQVAFEPTSPPLSQVEGELLIVVIPSWLAEKLGISDGSVVTIDNTNGKFNIRRRDAESIA